MKPTDFNSYGSRRGNHEVMVRGTFANVRLRNKLVREHEGGVTRLLPEGRNEHLRCLREVCRRRTPLVILAGKEYGSGSSRDWAAKGPRLLGVRAVIAQSYERIHRSNLVGMGILPLQFEAVKVRNRWGSPAKRSSTWKGFARCWNRSSPPEPGKRRAKAKRGHRVQGNGAH